MRGALDVNLDAIGLIANLAGELEGGGEAVDPGSETDALDTAGDGEPVAHGCVAGGWGFGCGGGVGHGGWWLGVWERFIVRTFTVGGAGSLAGPGAVFFPGGFGWIHSRNFLETIASQMGFRRLERMKVL